MADGKLGLGRDIQEDALSPRLVSFKPKGVRIRQCSAWHAHSLAVTADGELYSFGCGERGRLGHGNEKSHWIPKQVPFFKKGTPNSVAAAAAGELHSCVLTRSGRVFAFGDCSLGQTGRMQWEPLMAPTQVVLPELVDELAVGDHHTLLRTRGGQLLAFGKNIEGQLGLGKRGNGKLSVAEPSRVRWGPDETDKEAEPPPPLYSDADAAALVAAAEAAAAEAEAAAAEAIAAAEAASAAAAAAAAEAELAVANQVAAEADLAAAELAVAEAQASVAEAEAWADHVHAQLGHVG